MSQMFWVSYELLQVSYGVEQYHISYSDKCI